MQLIPEDRQASLLWSLRDTLWSPVSITQMKQEPDVRLWTVGQTHSSSGGTLPREMSIN